MDTTALPAFDIIAHSFGGRVAIALAAQHPALVRQMVLIGSAGMKPERTLKTQFKIVSAKILRKTADLIGGKAAITLRARYRKLGSSDWRAASEVMKGTLSRVLKEELSEECRAIKVPTLLIWGSEDRDTPLSAAHRMNSLIHESELFILPGAGHYCFLEKRGEVLSRIWQHLGLPNLW
jgi:pimeloyl-ACP methyl ester carboxylesterase